MNTHEPLTQPEVQGFAALAARLAENVNAVVLGKPQVVRLALTALFAQASVAGFDGITVIPGGWLDHHYVQLAIHLADSASGLGYSFVMTVRLFLHIFTSCERLSHTHIVKDNHPLDHALYTRPASACGRGD